MYAQLHEFHRGEVNVMLMRKNSYANHTAKEEDMGSEVTDPWAAVSLWKSNVSDNMVKYSVLKYVSFNKILLKIIYD